ncbi:MAG: sulfotransferase [Lutimonas sp.]
MAEKRKKGFLLPPAVGYSISVMGSLLLRNRVSLRYAPRLLITLIINLVNLPFRIYERLFINPGMSKTQLEHPPIFIVGHWRSGTTHLHNLLCKDPRMGYASTFQSVFPDTLFSWAGRFLFEGFARLLIPGTRKGDNVVLGTRLPQEEEFALGDKTPVCYYYFWMFPRRMREYYDRSVRMLGISNGRQESWRSDYKLLIAKALRDAGGDRFLSKNPPNTGRIRFLLETYPEAKFIHIHRNPVEVYLSTQNFFRKMMPHLQLQTVDPKQINEDIFEIYKMLMKDYLKQRSLIPEGQLVEVSFEELEKDPMRVTKEIYETLELNGFDLAEPHFQRYVDQMKSYKKNRHEIAPELADRIQREWGFAFDEWGYQNAAKS